MDSQLVPIWHSQKSWKRITRPWNRPQLGLRKRWHHLEHDFIVYPGRLVEESGAYFGPIIGTSRFLARYSCSDEQEGENSSYGIYDQLHNFEYCNALGMMNLKAADSDDPTLR